MRFTQGKVIWLTGLSGSGKSTLSSMLYDTLRARGVPAILLDGDTLRSGLNRDLGFSAADRAENIRRAAEVARILVDDGHTVLAAFITPLECLRAAARGLFTPGTFVELFLDCPLEVCEQRDPRGLYRRARSGGIREFTGVSAPFEPPLASDLVVSTAEQTVDESAASVLRFLEKQFPDLATRTRRGSRLRRPKVCVIGLDCVPPLVAFETLGGDLPNLRCLMEHGVWGPLRSTDPPITIPAWTTITTGKDPGQLGIYGFRNRRDHGYGEMCTADASHVQAPRLWDYLDENGLKSVLVGIPQTYPVRPHGGVTVAGFPGPTGRAVQTHPPELADELPEICGGDYLVDVEEFRTDRKDRLLRDLYTMVDRRFLLARDFLTRRPWDFFMMVEIATDRLHHGFWQYWRPDHKSYEPGNPYEEVIPDFYRYLDQRLGSLLGLLDDETTVVVLSDHGARTLRGGFCINEWLIRQGLLHLRAPVESPTALSSDMVDWSRTKAWSEGGYYARIFLNVKGREPLGTLAPEEYHSFREKLAVGLSEIPGENGDGLRNVVLRPDELFPECRNVPPDLMVYFDGLDRRSIGTVGTGRILTDGNNNGPDGANHDMDGIFVCARMADLRDGLRKGTRIEGATCLDITPTILDAFAVSVPAGLRGRVIPIHGYDAGASRIDPASSARTRASEPPQEPASMQGFTEDEENEVKKRLAELGYI
ncbi:MAG: adenylyl-sulfate kinase [Thermodesulfobacteriota bacterium]